MQKNSPYKAGFQPVIKTIVIGQSDYVEDDGGLDGTSIADLTDGARFPYDDKKRNDIISRVLKTNDYSVRLSQNKEELLMYIDFA